VRFISPTIHGVLDYLFAATSFTLPRLLGWSGRSTRLMTGVSLGTLACALLTRYRLGPVKILPMPAHLGIDAALDAALVAAQFQLSEEESSVRGVILGMAAFGALATLITRMTETEETTDE
jgi:hypothetical protein